MAREYALTDEQAIGSGIPNLYCDDGSVTFSTDPDSRNVGLTADFDSAGLPAALADVLTSPTGSILFNYDSDEGVVDVDSAFTVATPDQVITITATGLTTFVALGGYLVPMVGPAGAGDQTLYYIGFQFSTHNAAAAEAGTLTITGPTGFTFTPTIGQALMAVASGTGISLGVGTDAVGLHCGIGVNTMTLTTISDNNVVTYTVTGTVLGTIAA